MKENINLVLFFTKDVSLQTWDEVGVLGREISLYKKLYDKGVRTTFITYGDKRDLEYQKDIPYVKIACNNWGLPGFIYGSLINFLHKNILKSADIIKTNQSPGGDIALKAASRFKKDFIARCGYMSSEFYYKVYGKDSKEYKINLKTEEDIFINSDKVIVTTPMMKKSIVSRFSDLSEKIRVIPNFVDTSLFSPDESVVKEERSLCFIGRLGQEQKNLLSLLDAVDSLDVSLYLVGSGPLENEVKQRAASNGRIHYIGRLENHELPKIINSCSVFILPSFYEGHPKSLIEAMACGATVIASNVDGIKEIIEHKRHGYLCDTNTQSIKEAIESVLGDDDLRETLSQNARNFAIQNYSLEHIVEMEITIYHGLLSK